MGYAIVWLVDNVIGLMILFIIASAILSWLFAFDVINHRNRFVNQLAGLLDAVTRPLLEPFRRIIPNLGGIDISPIVVILLLAYVCYRLLGTNASLATIGQLSFAAIGQLAPAMFGALVWKQANRQGVFAGLNKPLTVTRYHSLVVKRDTLPECLEATAWTQHADGSVDEIMGLRHKTLNIEGVQFHPESILTEQGHELFANFLKQTGGVR